MWCSAGLPRGKWSSEVNYYILVINSESVAYKIMHGSSFKTLSLSTLNSMLIIIQYKVHYK